MTAVQLHFVLLCLYIHNPVTALILNTGTVGTEVLTSRPATLPCEMTQTLIE